MPDDQISRAEIVGYLTFLANHAEADNSVRRDFESQHPQFPKEAYRLLRAGLLAAASQIERGVIDHRKWAGIKPI